MAVQVDRSVRGRVSFLVAVLLLTVGLMGPARAADPDARSTRVAVVLVNFRNNPATPFSAADARAWTFTDGRSVAALYREISYDRLGMTGDAFGWLTLDQDDSTCDVAAWQAAADGRARQAGIDVDGYDVVVYAAPLVSSCGFRGASSIGANRSFVNGATTRGQWVPLVGHELGHAFGAEHANTLRCVDGSGQAVILSTTCQTEMYGDPFDLMGSGYRRHPNAAHKAAMGLLPASAVHTVEASGDFRIGPLESAGADPRLLRVPYDRDTDGDVRYLMLEFRQPSAFDEFADTDPGVQGVLVRLGKDADRHAPTLLIDTTPETAGNFADAPLMPKRALVDKRRNLSVAVLETGPGGAVVHVEYAGFVADWAGCEGVTVPARVGRGRAVPVEARFRNTGTTTWTSADGYGLETAGADAGPGALSSTEPVSPGAIGVFTSTFTAPSNVGRVTITWTPRIGSQVFGEACSATVDVVADADPPAVPTGLRSTVQSQTSTQLAWAASSDNAGVKGYRVEKSTDGVTFAPLTDVAGTSVVASGLVVNTPYWFRVLAYDGGGNVSAPSGVVRVQIPDVTAPTAPTNLRVTGRGPGSLDLAWSPATDNVGVDRYRVYRRANALSPYVVVAETATPTYRDTGLGSQSYSYFVRAVDKAGNVSAQSNAVSGTPQTCAVSGGVCF
jgi:chitodextrinase